MTQAQTSNPLLGTFDTLHGTVPFSKIKVTDYEPAIDEGIRLGLQDVDNICANPATPDFNNTIVALENSGKALSQVLNIFGPLSSAMTDDEMMDISMRISPKLSDYSTTISLNPELWKRVKYVWDNTDQSKLSPEDRMLLKTTYDGFVRSGALLVGDDRETFRRLNTELSELTTRFSQNVLKELNTYEIWLTDDDLAGLPEGIVEAAALAAKEKGREGEYLFTLAQPTYMAFMKNSDRRDLREKMYRLYSGRNIKGEYSNLEVIQQIADKRRQLANLLGYPTFADYNLVNTMAEKPENVYKLLNDLRDAYRPAQQREFEEIVAFASEKEGKKIDLMPWDYSYYSNKLKQARYDYDEEALRPYFELSNVIDGVFGLATKLYGLT
ncbi:MAG: peptidase M3, partial [Paramuribaculum sp.]|nr:peptidase M3 [Paramuribaculum sp.]